MSNTIKIRGGKKLQGKIKPIPNKNSIVAALPASILSEKTITYKNVPQTSDVEDLIKMLRYLGAEIDDSDFDNLQINCSSVNRYEIDTEEFKRIRASIMFVGPLLARFGKAKVALPGGCALGKRSIAAHIDAFQKAGVKISYVGNFIEFAYDHTKSSKPITVWQNEASVTATENLIMFLSGIESESESKVIDAAMEPHVGQVANLLTQMGTEINGIGSNTLVIKGNKNLNEATFVPEPDFVDIAGYFVAAAVTKGHITLEGANVPHVVDGLIDWFSKFNLNIQKSGENLIVDGRGELKIDLQESGFPLAGNNLPKLYPRPWPGFPVDVIPVMATLASKTKGHLLLMNWMYENGLDFIRELNKIGANVFVSSPQRVIINGPVKFTGGEIHSPGVIQACKALFLAALADDVETTIHGANVLRRRYPNIFEVYKSLGADIEVY